VAEANEGREARCSDEGCKRRYARPEIAWEEEYKPTAFGVSCAKVVGTPACGGGPLIV